MTKPDKVTMAEFDNGYEALIQAFQILKQYTDRRSNIYCEHDQMNAHVEEEPTEEEIEELEDYGFYQKDDNPTHFYSFWHGSC